MDKTDLMTALDRAIEAEEKAHAFYLQAADKTDDRGGAKMFRELAEFEVHHRTHLDALKKSLLADQGWIDYPAKDLGGPPKPEGPAVKVEAGDHADALEALRVAISAEEQATAEYQRLAAAAPDAKGQAMFARLAEEESLHRRLLDDQYYALTNDGVWLWGD